MNYLMGQCNDLFNQGNYEEAIKCYDKIIQLGNQTNTPIFNEVVVQSGYYMDALGRNNSSQEFSKLSAEPINSTEIQPDSDSEPLTISFDISNPNSMHMRISNIYVNVNKYYPIINPKIIQNFAKGYNRGYYCTIKPAVGSYKCVLTAKDYDFIDLAPNELEHIVINVGTETPGAYDLRISLDYAIGSKTNRIIVGEVPGIIGFFDKDLLQSQY